MDIKKIQDLIGKVMDCGLSAKKWCILTIAVAFGIVGGAALLVFTVDPHYRYHAPWFYDTVYYEIYATAPHLLKYEEYDLFMLGTSMTRNFYLEDINQTFHCNSIKFAASGGTIRDLCKFFEIASTEKGKKLKRVILSLDLYSMNKDYTHWEDFDFMYRKDHSKDYRYLFSRQTFSSMHYLLKRKINPVRQRAHQTDRNKMFSTDYKGKPYGLQEVMKDALKNEIMHHTLTPYNEAAHQANLFQHFLPLFRSRPDIQFTVYLPPYHIYTYCQSHHFGEAEALIRQRTAVMRELIKIPNVKLYDFQADRTYVTHHDYFSDVQHFSNSAARRVLQDIAGDRRRIATEKQVVANKQELRALIAEKMPEFYANMEQIKKMRRK